MITITLNAQKTLLSAFGRNIVCSSIVRNELGTGALLRPMNQVVLTEPSPGQAYMPRSFPSGTWSIGKPEQETSDPAAYIRGWWIPTTAGQNVIVWNTEEQESQMVYTTASGVTLWDSGYGIHCSASPTTLGCLRVGEPWYPGISDAEWEKRQLSGMDDLEYLAQQILATEEPVTLIAL